jgi:hypothetical protein
MKRLLPFVVVPMLLLAVLSLSAQEGPPAAPHAPNPPRHFYRLHYVLKETDEGKVINQRTFTLTACTSTGERCSSRLRAGSRFPVSEEKQTNYVDVGVNIDNRLVEVPDGLEMDVTAEVSSPGTDAGTSGSAPVIRQLRTNSQAIAALAKPTVLFTIDDPASRHRFELEVTASREH